MNKVVQMMAVASLAFLGGGAFVYFQLQSQSQKETSKKPQQAITTNSSQKVENIQDQNIDISEYSSNPYLVQRDELFSFYCKDISRKHALRFVSKRLGVEIEYYNLPKRGKISLQENNITLQALIKKIIGGPEYFVFFEYATQQQLPSLVIVSKFSLTEDNQQVQITEAARKNQQAHMEALIADMVANQDEFEKWDRPLPELKQAVLNPGTSTEEKLGIIDYADLLEDDEARELLREALHDKDEEVVLEAIDSLSFIGNDEDVAILKDMLTNNPSPEVTKAIEETIDFIDPEDGGLAGPPDASPVTPDPIVIQMQGIHAEKQAQKQAQQ